MIFKQREIFTQKIGFEMLSDIYSEEKARYFLLLSGFGLEIEVFRFDQQDANRFVAPDLQTEGLQHFALPVDDLERKSRSCLIGASLSLRTYL